MPTTEAIFFYTVRHVEPVALPYTSKSSVTLRLLPLPNQKTLLYDYSAHQSTLSLVLTQTSAELRLSCLDPLLEATFTAAVMACTVETFAPKPEPTWNKRVDIHAAGRDRSLDSVHTTELSLMDGIDGMTPGVGYIRAVKYFMRAEFTLPDAAIPPSVSSVHPDAANDFCFIFPREPGRDTLLFANSSRLSAASPYFRLLFATLPCVGHGILQKRTSTFTWAKLFADMSKDYARQHALPPPLLTYDSDDEKTQRTHFRRVPSSYGRKLRATSQSQSAQPPPERAGPGEPPLSIRYILVKHAQWRTVRAILHWLVIGGNVLPSTLLSTDPESRRWEVENGYHAASPKSVYRLAKQFGIVKLQEWALGEVCKQVVDGHADLVEELTSETAMDYKELRDSIVKGYLERRPEKEVTLARFNDEREYEYAY